MVIRKSLYNEMHGLDEKLFPVDYNDIDLCLRLHCAGYRNIVSAQSVVWHHEGQTKKKEKTWNMTDMLSAERALLDRHWDVTDPYINPNLEFHYSQSILAMSPPRKPWSDADRSRVLLINGRPEDAREAFREGLLPFCASLEGHYLMFTIPTMQHVRGIDLRGDVSQIGVVLAKLGIEQIIFHGIGDGTLGSLGFFTALAKNGFWITYNPRPHADTKNEFDYYTSAGWESSWEEFQNAIGRGGDSAAD